MEEPRADEPDSTHQTTDYTPGGPSYANPFVLLIALLAAYALSVGPAALLCKHYPAAEKPLGMFYAPLEALYKSCRPVQAFYDWYLVRVWKVK